MTYMQSNLAFAGGIQELSLEEIGFVIGGKSDKIDPRPSCPREYKLVPYSKPSGFFEAVGEAFDNPGKTIGMLVDAALSARRAGAGKGTGYWANGVYNIK